MPREQILAAEKIELPDTIQVGLLMESQKNHQVQMGDLSFAFAMQRYSSLFNTKSLELGHQHAQTILDMVSANELLRSEDPMTAGLMNLFARAPQSIEHPAFSPSVNQPSQTKIGAA